MLPIHRGWKLGGTGDDGTSIYVPPPPVTPPGNTARSLTPPMRPLTPPTPVRALPASPPAAPPAGVTRFVLPRLALDKIRPPSPSSFSFEKFVVSVLPEARARPTATVQTFLRRAASARVGDKWHAGFEEFQKLIGNGKVEISDFRQAAALTTAPENNMELREFSLAVISLAPNSEVSLAQKLIFGFGLFDWKESGRISDHQLMCLLNGLLLRHGPCKASDLENRKKKILAAERLIDLPRLLKTGAEHPEFFEKTNIIPVSASRRSSSDNSVAEYKRLTSALDAFGEATTSPELKPLAVQATAVGKPRVVQFHTDYHNVKMNRIVGNKKVSRKFIDLQTKTYLVVLGFVALTVGIFVLRHLLATGAAISALLDALGAFSGFAALVMIGTVCLKSSLDEDVHTDREHEDLEEGGTPDP